MKALITNLWRLLPLVLVLLLVAPARAAETTTLTIEVNADTPAGTSVVGVLTADLVRTGRTTFKGSWEFHGTLNGRQATSSGQLVGSGGTRHLTLRVTSIDSWEMAGFRQPPIQPAITIRRVGNLAYVTWRGITAPLAVEGQIGNPFLTGETYLRVTAPGAGGERVRELPNTGWAPSIPPIASWVAVAVLGLALISARGLVRAR